MIPTDRLLVLAGAASLFSLTSSYIIQPSCNTTYQPFIYVGCYTDDRDSRSLPLNPGLDFGSLTVEKCTAACKVCQNLLSFYACTDRVIRVIAINMPAWDTMANVGAERILQPTPPPKQTAAIHAMEIKKKTVEDSTRYQYMPTPRSLHIVPPESTIHTWAATLTITMAAPWIIAKMPSSVLK